MKAEKKEPAGINLYFFRLSIGMVFSYIYIIASMSLHIINRILYNKYNFRFNFFFMFIQQLFCLLFFTCIASKNKNFQETAGEISFKDFKKFKFDYLIFSSIFILNYLSSFWGNQAVKSSATYFCLRKFSLLMNFIYGIIVHGKPFQSHYLITIACIIAGSLLTAKDDLSIDFKGILVVTANNVLTTLYGYSSENFRKKNKIPNLKLIVYNTFLASPILIILIFTTGEFGRILKYFSENGPKEGFLIGFIPTLSLICLLVVILNSSCMISNEKNSSLFTSLLANCKDIFISLISCFVIGEFKGTPSIFLGICISTLGALIFSAKNIMDAFFKKKDDKGKKDDEKKPLKKSN